MIGKIKKFERRHDDRSRKTAAAIDDFNVPRLVGIRKVHAVPRHQKMTAMPRGQREVHGIAKKPARHQLLLNVVLREFPDFRCFIKAGKTRDQIDDLSPFVWNAEQEFDKYCVTRHPFIFLPFPSHHFLVQFRRATISGCGRSSW